VRRRASFAIGWWFGFGYFFFGLYWIGFSFMVEADKFAVFMPFAVTALPAGLAIFTGTATLAARHLWFRGYGRIVVLAIAWTVAEWLRGHVLTGFPWNLIGESFTSSLALMQWAALVGSYGLSFMAILITAAPAIFDPYTEDTYFEGQSALSWPHWIVPGVALAALALLWLGGTARLAMAVPEPAPGPEATMLRIVQPNIPQTQKWKPESRMEVLGEFLRLSAQPTIAAPQGLTPHSVVIWPESALAIFLAREPFVLSAISHILPKGAMLLTGSVRGEAAPDGPPDLLQKFYNSLYAVNDEGRIIATYDKSHLVPFGEYLPYHHWLAKIGLKKLSQVQGSFDEGPGPVTMSLPGLPPFSPLICYEIIFPGKVVSRGERPDWIVNVTNDAWFGTSSGPYQHLSQVRLRAVEQGLPVARAANTGVSAVINAYGRVIAEKPLNTEGVLDVALPAPLAPPPYARFGDWILLGLWLLAAAGLAIAQRGLGRWRP
jgi:apolipoprotein N-acyltransferase